MSKKETMSSSYINLTTIMVTTVILSTIFALTTIGPATILKRLQKTKYNYEVTLALYMLTPTERFIFSTSHPLLLPSSDSQFTNPLPAPRRPATNILCLLDSILFLALSLLLIAAFLYLPEHIATISRRAFYYCFGDDNVQTGHYSAHVTEDAARMTINMAKATMDAVAAGAMS
jgi:Small subunit of serine palmitoyltransferase-like